MRCARRAPASAPSSAVPCWLSQRTSARLSSTSRKATSTVCRYDATLSSWAARAPARLELLRPPSNTVCATVVPISGPSIHVREDHLNRFDRSADSKPNSAVSEIRGKNAAFATPIRALAAAICRSAAAMSGRRSSSSDGRPAGTATGAVSKGRAASVNCAGGTPVSTASACSWLARRRSMPARSARAVPSSASARAGSRSVVSPAS
ncbi:hypothetical protein D3C72_1065060 [compost metagenome]